MGLQTKSIVPQRSTALAAVIGLHAGLIYLLATGLATRTIQLLAPVFSVDYVEEMPIPRTPPPPQQTQLDPVKPDLPVTPEIPIDAAPESDAPALNAAREAPRPQETAPVVKVPGGVDKGFPNMADFYPASAIRRGQEGAAAVRVCVDATGRLSAEPSLAQSSNLAILDAAALRLARAGSGHYRPATENGRPVSSCYPINVRFHIRP